MHMSNDYLKKYIWVYFSGGSTLGNRNVVIDHNNNATIKTALVMEYTGKVSTASLPYNAGRVLREVSLE